MSLWHDISVLYQILSLAERCYIKNVIEINHVIKLLLRRLIYLHTHRTDFDTEGVFCITEMFNMRQKYSIQVIVFTLSI